MKHKLKGKNIVLILIIIVIAVIIILIIWPSKPHNKRKRQIQNEVVREPVFRKDGELKFVDDGSIKKTISIEIVQSEAERTQGLMFRKSMPDSCGMLFIFEDMQPLSFWMKNTHIPLDIIFIDNDFKIVSIAKNTVPFSTTSIPSGKEAMYALELNAGFCDKNGIKEGVKIKYNLTNII
ncbi:MAG: DUF192 domain-containing protein [Bacteroidales bacterium]|jgi:hypothetical protein|nr:DUF192 domain-containing protein [Bacteroidales bacterium]MDD4214319.1 DUF192 domain-containing protein [Bacteroidales bacterium]